MEPLGKYLTFINRPLNRPVKVLEPKEEPLKVFDSKTGTEEKPGLDIDSV